MNPDAQSSLFEVEPRAINLLIALLPDARLQQAIDAQRRRWQWPEGARFPPRRRLHLTLQAPGWVHVDRVAAVHEALSAIPVGEMHLVLRQPECWNVAVLRADVPESLRQLRQRVTLALLQLKLPVCKAWVPHITIARGIDSGVARPPANAPSLPWTATDFALIWSRRTPVASHQVLARYGAPPLCPVRSTR